ncbi:Predicted transcriptional regulator [Algoriphagus alkaliphilus]|uniref:Predicted transcriptional regulator n=2 Tax=Algoriphagus alkaliphilus TaxID=279824 RepID=A0A1G5YAH8_9BACT|nr:Predicted transcriptional regulator [Algoriphagus alkaliphilus]
MKIRIPSYIFGTKVIVDDLMNKPTESELEILSLLWEMKEASVRQIHERLAETKDTGYTTTLKTMQIMYAKGMVTRDEENRSHIYRPKTNQQETQNSLLKSLMSTAFGGSSKALVMQALGQDNPSKDEIDEIRAFLDQLENS